MPAASVHGSDAIAIEHLPIGSLLFAYRPWAPNRWLLLHAAWICQVFGARDSDTTGRSFDRDSQSGSHPADQGARSRDGEWSFSGRGVPFPRRRVFTKPVAAVTRPTPRTPSREFLPGFSFCPPIFPLAPAINRPLGYQRVTGALAICRRLVTVHCLYGIDIDPLAVELAKLSLWLGVFRRGIAADVSRSPADCRRFDRGTVFS
jgi:hypothetical protein